MTPGAVGLTSVISPTSSPATVENRGNGGRDDAVRARILRMHRGSAERQPGRLARRRRIGRKVGIADGGHGTPEIVGILAVEDCDEGIDARDGTERIQTGAVLDIHLPGQRDLPDDGIVGAGPGEEPEASRRRLLRGAPGAGIAADFTNFIQVPGPDFRVECRGRRRAELRSGAHGPRCHLKLVDSIGMAVGT